MALFVCSCENKTYAGFFNNKDCKDCGTKIHNSKKVIIPDAGHAVNIDQPNIFNAEVLTFLS